jgi:hypothetical protein
MSNLLDAKIHESNVRRAIVFVIVVILWRETVLKKIELQKAIVDANAQFVKGQRELGDALETFSSTGGWDEDSFVLGFRSALNYLSSQGHPMDREFYFPSKGSTAKTRANNIKAQRARQVNRPKTS